MGLTKRKSREGDVGAFDEITQLVTALSSEGGTLWKFDPSRSNVRGKEASITPLWRLTEWRGAKERQSRVFFAVLAH